MLKSLKILVCFCLRAGYPAIHKLSFKLAQTDLIFIQLISCTGSLWTRIP